MSADKINLRCPKCGTIRTPVISPHLPDRVMVVCATCWRRHLEWLSLDETRRPSAPTRERPR